ncbi:PilZ domain-containing protein [Ectopseudomonas mendocina]|uniref:PilZ domain-containing protein n=1 Tax=Ectopseudomonas mendocina TaxID=300 RepID=A0ABZ2RKN8_ECTME
MRQHPRITFRSMFRIKISRVEDDQLIGYVGDISEGGLRMLGDNLLEPGSEHHLRLRMRDRFGEMRQVDVQTICQWSAENTRTGHVESGMALKNESHAYNKLLADIRSKPAK